jgi:integrase/recombinase XerC
LPSSGKARTSPTAPPWRRRRAIDPLFVGVDEQRITTPTVQYHVERSYLRADVNGQRAKGTLVHQLRHTFATSLADNIYTLMRLLGHESIPPHSATPRAPASTPVLRQQ